MSIIRYFRSLGHSNCLLFRANSFIREQKDESFIPVGRGNISPYFSSLHSAIPSHLKEREKERSTKDRIYKKQKCCSQETVWEQGEKELYVEEDTATVSRQRLIRKLRTNIAESTPTPYFTTTPMGFSIVVDNSKKKDVRHTLCLGISVQRSHKARKANKIKDARGLQASSS